MTWTRSALIGGILWIVGLAFGFDASTNRLGASLLFLGCGVAAPLAFSLIDTGPTRGRFGVALWLHRNAIALLFISFLRAPGPLAGALSIPWLLLTFLAAAIGVIRFAERGGGPMSEMAIDAGFVLLAIGGVWNTASRFGVGLAGFSEPWVLLTAAHFHFAGLVLPVITGLAGRMVPGRLGTVASFGAATGVPFVAVGITAGAQGWATVEWLAAMWLVVGSLLAAAVIFQSARTLRSTPAVLLTLAPLSLSAGMVLVGVYATSMWMRNPWLSILDMLRSHAPLNSVGFALLALMGMRLATRKEVGSGMEILLPWLRDKPAPGLWQERSFGPAVSHADRSFVTDRNEVELSREAPGAPVPDGVFQKTAQRVLAYRAFPDEVLLSLRARPDAPVTLGETIPAKYRLLPGVHIVFASRVVAIFDESNGTEHRTGFQYRTLAGHPECGEETFYVRKELATGRVFAGLWARSRPNNTFVRVLNPIARRLQLAAGRAATANLREGGL